jgi:hypothetical protein
MSQVGSRNVKNDLHLAAAWGAGTAAAVLLLVTILAVPVIHARTTIAPEPEIAQGRATCVDRYNALVDQAKHNVTTGDLPAAVRLLRAAQAQLHICDGFTTQDL